jgi:hypothetical protein
VLTNVFGQDTISLHLDYSNQNEKDYRNDENTSDITFDYTVYRFMHHNEYQLLCKDRHKLLILLQMKTNIDS